MSELHPFRPVLTALCATAIAFTACGDGATESENSVTEPEFIVRTQPQQLLEGLALRDGNAYVSFALSNQVYEVTADGEIVLYGSAPQGLPPNTFVNGVEFDDAGNLYVGQASFVDEPTAGVYRIPPGGGDATYFGSHDVGLVFPSGMTFDPEGNMYVSDSSVGAIFRITPDGVTTNWVSDPSLVSTEAERCVGEGGPGVPVGVNGIIYDQDDGHLYLTNTDRGMFMRVAVRSDGPGEVETLISDCDMLHGSDGLTTDGDGWIIAVNFQDRIVRVDPSFDVTVLAEGGLLESPASVAIETTESGRALWITNLALTNFLNGAESNPGVLRMGL